MFNRIFKNTIFSIILQLFWTVASFADEAELSFYVSTMGNYFRSGQLPSPNTREGDGPFATLEKARDAIRGLKRSGTLPQGGVTVYIRNGIYQISKTFHLTVEDSGTKSALICWQAYHNEEVCFTGAFVTSKAGAIPKYDMNEIEQILASK